MTLTEVASWFDSALDTAAFSHDASQNGIQVSNSAPDSKPVSRIACAVDACVETIRRAECGGADVLFVHHGLLWGKSEPVAGVYYRRVKALLDADIALYGCHLPLDAHPLLGNNYGLAARLGLVRTAPFGVFHGTPIGVIGETPGDCSIDALLGALFPGYEDDCAVYPFGKRSAIRRVAIVSGAAGNLAGEAVARGADCFITGEFLHQDYHSAEERGITVIACGHYRSETLGVNLVAAKVKACLGIDTFFVDIPTGL